MGASPAVHPTDQSLSAFGLGKLDDAAAEAIGAHLEECTECRKRVAELPADSFLGRAREAERSSAGPRPAARSPADTLPPGLAEHPDYEIKKELGHGGMGVVYLARNTLMGRDEVLKVIGRQVIERPGMLDRFLREIRAVARLRHPNIVSAYSATRLGESIVFAMEYVEGLDLAKLVRAKGPLPVAHACYFVSQAALGLQHAHEEGLVHRDIKPANLMLSRKGDRATIKILDFGLAKATLGEKLDGGLTSHGQALGTPDFIAPEQILDAPKADIRADIYGLGGTLYYLLTGRPPFEADSLYDIYQAHISREADRLNLVRPEVPAELAAVVAKMMAKGPAHRFQTPAEVAAALRPFCTTRPAGARPETSQIAPEAPAPAVQADVAWATLIDVRGSAPSWAPPAAAVQATSRRPPRVWGAAASGIIATGLLVGFIVVPRKHKDATAQRAATPPAPVSRAVIDRPAPVGKPAPDPAVDPRKNPATGPVDEAPTPLIKLVSDAMTIGDAPVTKKEPVADASIPLIKLVSDAMTIGDAPVTKKRPTPVAARRPWVPVIANGVWTVRGDELVTTSVDRDPQLLFLTEQFLSHYDFHFKARCEVEGPVVFLVPFHYAGKDNVRYYRLGAWQNHFVEIIGHTNGASAPLVRKKMSMARDRWYDVKLSIRGGAYRAYLDGVELFFCPGQPLTEGRIGLGTVRGTARFKDIEVSDPDGNVLFQGLPDLSLAGR